MTHNVDHEAGKRTIMELSIGWKDNRTISTCYRIWTLDDDKSQNDSEKATSLSRWDVIPNA
jgi:hypothetical protein